MPQYSGFNNRFNAGELEPQAWGDSDLQQYQHGCAVGRNYVVNVAGPLVRRPGFRFNGLTRDQINAPQLVEFKRSPESAFMLEVGAGYVNVWNPDGSPNAATFANPWTQAQLPQLRWLQSGNVVYFTCADGSAPQRLKYDPVALTWTLGPLVFKRGPWRTENSDATSTLAFSAYTGSGITCTASKPIFTPAHVGCTFRVRGQISGAAIGGWAPSYQLTYQYELVASAGRIYLGLDAVPGSGTHMDTGTNAPVHDQGTASDGVNLYTYIHNGAGIVLVTGYTDANHVTVTTITNLPTTGVSTPDANGHTHCVLTPGGNPAIPATPFWAECAYSARLGWPTAWPGMDEERVVFAAGLSELDTFNATNTDGFDLDSVTLDPEFGTGQVLDTDPIRRLAGSVACRVVWFCATTLMMCGTTAGEVVISGATTLDPIAPASTRAKNITYYGAADVRPMQALQAIVYVIRGLKRLREVKFDQYFQTNSGRDLSLLVSHIGARGFAQIVWDATRNQLWCRLSDGGLACFSYDVDNQVFGWTQQQIGNATWFCEALGILPGSGGMDTLWMIASRPKGGGFQRAMFTMADRAAGVFWDGAQVYAGPPVGAVGNIGLFEGEKVSAIADGAQYDNLPVTGGVCALPAGVTGSNICIGQPYASYFESLPLDLGGTGFTQMKRTRLKQGLVSLFGYEAFVGDDTGDLEHVIDRADTEGLTLSPKTLIQKVTFAGEVGRDPRVVISYSGGFDLEIHAIKPLADAND